MITSTSTINYHCICTFEFTKNISQEESATFTYMKEECFYPSYLLQVDTLFHLHLPMLP